MRQFIFISLLYSVVHLVVATPASAGTLCDYYKSNVQNLYRILCKDQQSSQSSTKPAGANSTFSSAFNVNTASLPNEPSPYGIETIGSVLRERTQYFQPTFSLVKGFNKFGTGVSTSGNNTFYGNDIIQRSRGRANLETFSAWEKQKSSFPHLNVGTSFKILQTKSGINTSLGLSARHNGTTGTFGGGPALMFHWKIFTLGGGMTREKVSSDYSYITFTQALASIRLLFFEFEFTQLNNFGGPSLTPIQIFTATSYLGSITLTGAIRHFSTYIDGPVKQPHFAIQYSVNNRLSLGYLYNFMPGASSVAAQVFLW